VIQAVMLVTLLLALSSSKIIKLSSLHDEIFFSEAAFILSSKQAF